MTIFKGKMKKFAVRSMVAVSLMGVGVGTSNVLFDNKNDIAYASIVIPSDFTIPDVEFMGAKNRTIKYSIKNIKIGQTGYATLPKIDGYIPSTKVKYVCDKDGTVTTSADMLFYYKPKKSTPKSYKSKVYAVKQVNQHKFKKTYIKYSKGGYIYNSRTLKTWSHKGANYKHTKWSTNQSRTIKKSNGKTAVYYYITNKSNGIKGWIWKGYLKSTPAN